MADAILYGVSSHVECKPSINDMFVHLYLHPRVYLRIGGGEEHKGVREG
jgi:hypothetical protein